VPLQRGRLRDPASGPAVGEETEQLLLAGDLVVEHILSGRLDEPVEYDQEGDEWVLLLSGAATVEADGETFALEPGDWLFLPAHVPHCLVETAGGSAWLAVHRRAGPRRGRRGGERF
jgi:cupin 2 domain-containing protein